MGVGAGSPDVRPLTVPEISRILVMMGNSLEGLGDSILPPTIDSYVILVACHVGC